MTTLSDYRKKPVVIQAAQWWTNGDHPDDYALGKLLPDDNGPLEQDGIKCRFWTPAEQRENDWEGQVVRRYRHPDVPGFQVCKHCRLTMHEHGWIDTLEGGHTVCPGDWIITGVQGERYPCKPDIFDATYEPA